MATVTTLTSSLPSSNVVAFINLNGNLYASDTNLFQIHPTTGVVNSISGNATIGGNMPYSLATYKTRIYGTNGSIMYYDLSGGAKINTGISSGTFGACALDNFLYYTNNDNILRRVNLDTHIVDTTWTVDINIMPYSAVGYAGFIYVGINSSNPIYKISVADKNRTTFINSVSAPSSSSIFGLEIHNNSLYVSLQNAKQINRYDLDDPTDRTVPFASISALNPCGITAFNNKLYALGYQSSSIVSMGLPTNTIPANITLDDVNTYNVASGNVQVSIVDVNNISTNKVSYWYSTNGGVPNIKSNVSNNGPSQTNYRFYIPLSSGTYTISVYAKNPAGNSSIVSKNVTVNTTPFAPIIDQGNTKSITSGNLNVAFTDTLNVANNQVEYTYLMYDTTIANKIFYL